MVVGFLAGTILVRSVAYVPVSSSNDAMTDDGHTIKFSELGWTMRIIDLQID